jgi:hypothetical protein
LRKSLEVVKEGTQAASWCKQRRLSVWHRMPPEGVELFICRIVVVLLRI